MHFFAGHTILAAGIAIAVIIVLIIMTGYRKAPPDKVYIISGRGDKKKVPDRASRNQTSDH